MKRTSDDRRRGIDGVSGNIGGTSEAIRDNNAGDDSGSGNPRTAKVRKSNERGDDGTMSSETLTTPFTRMKVESILRMARCCPPEIQMIEPMR